MEESNLNAPVQNFHVKDESEHVKDESKLVKDESENLGSGVRGRQFADVIEQKGLNIENFISVVKRDKAPVSFSLAQQAKKFKSIKVDKLVSDGNTKKVELNIGSLSKRTGISIPIILLRKVTGTLTEGYIQQKAMETNEHTQNINAILNHGVNYGLDREEMKNQIATAEKTNDTASKVVKMKLHDDNEHGVVFQKLEGRLQVVVTGGVLGAGAFGKAVEAIHLNTNTLNAIKVVHEAKGNRALGIECEVLNHIHSAGIKEGVQRPPLMVCNFTQSFAEGVSSQEKMGMMIPLYDTDLTHPEIAFHNFATSSEKEIVKSFIPILKALAQFEEKGIVHFDIKPANLCFQDGEIRMADFGGSVLSSELSSKPIKTQQFISTPTYSSPNDIGLVKQFHAQMQNPDEEKSAEERFMEVGGKNDVYCLGKSIINILRNENRDVNKNFDKYIEKDGIKTINSDYLRSQLEKKFPGISDHDCETIIEITQDYCQTGFVYQNKPRALKQYIKTFEERFKNADFENKGNDYLSFIKKDILPIELKPLPDISSILKEQNPEITKGKLDEMSKIVENYYAFVPYYAKDSETLNIEFNSMKEKLKDKGFEEYLPTILKKILPSESIPLPPIPGSPPESIEENDDTLDAQANPLIADDFDYLEHKITDEGVKKLLCDMLESSHLNRLSASALLEICEKL